jgi:hypothetical protein
VSDRPAGRASGLQIALWAASMALGLFLSLRAYDAFQVGVYSDDAVYAVLARSLIGDRGFGLINTPGEEPASSPYPFGYPLVLAPLAAVAPRNLDLLKLPSLLATFANGALLFWGWDWFSRRSRWWGVAVAGLYVLSPTVVSHSVMVMSEAVFTTGCLLAMLLTEQIARGRPILWRALPVGAVCTVVLLTRSVGVVLAPALLAYLLWRKGRAAWRSIGLAAAAGLILTAFILLAAPVKWTDLLPSRYLTEGNNSLYLIIRQAGAAAQPDLPGSTQEAVRSTPLLVLDRARRHLTMDLRQAVLPVNGQGIEQEVARRFHIPWLSMAVALLTLALVAVGWWVWWARDGMTAFGFGALVYLGASLFWDWRGPRLLYPVIPQLLLGFLIGFEAVWRFVLPKATPSEGHCEERPSRRSRSILEGCKLGLPETLPRAFTLGLVVVLGVLSFHSAVRIPDSRLHTGDLSARTDWLRVNTPDSAVVMSEQAATDFLYGDRRTVPQPEPFGSSADLENFLTGERVDYILVGPAPGWHASYAPAYSRSTAGLLPLLAELQAAGRISPVYSASADRITVFRTEP